MALRKRNREPDPILELPGSIQDDHTDRVLARKLADHRRRHGRSPSAAQRRTMLVQAQQAGILAETRRTIGEVRTDEERAEAELMLARKLVQVAGPREGLLRSRHRAGRTRADKRRVAETKLDLR